MLLSTLFVLQVALFRAPHEGVPETVPTLASQIQETEAGGEVDAREAEDDEFTLPASTVPS